MERTQRVNWRNVAARERRKAVLAGRPLPPRCQRCGSTKKPLWDRTGLCVDCVVELKHGRTQGLQTGRK